MNRNIHRPKGHIAFVGIKGCAIVEQVAARYGTTARSLHEDTIRRSVALPRQHAMCALRQAGFTERAIATYFGRERSTVSTGDTAHRARMAWAEALISLAPDAQTETAVAA